jgi:hypothetical protein
MGVARLVAKGWIVFCLFAAAHAIHMHLATPAYAPAIVVSMLLFAAMGLLFATGYGVSARDGTKPLIERLKPHHLMPDFNGIVFLIFVVLSWLNQILFAPFHPIGAGIGAIVNAIQFAVPGQDALLVALAPCAPDGGRVFSSAFAWILAIIFVASAISRIRLAAGLLRLERTTRSEVLGAPVHAAVLGIAAIAGIQMFFIGSAYPWFGCQILAGLPGTVIIGLAPLLLAYLIVAALTAAVALSPEKQ